jgi:GTP-binding protein HflX
MTSFKSTLEEAKESNLRIILVDSSSEVIEEELEETRKVMDFLEISDSDNILTFNKIDRVIDSALLNHLQKKYPKAVFISAKENKGFKELLERINAYKKRFRN